MPPGPCTTAVRYGEDISEVQISPPAPGVYAARIWLEDQDGNTDPSKKGDPVLLRFDDAVPGVPHLVSEARWIKAGAPPTLTAAIELAGLPFPPVSGIAGYSYTVDGSQPDATIDVIALQDYERYSAAVHLAVQNEGISVLKMRSISGAGVASTAVGEAVVRVDRTRPSVEALHQPASQQWTRAPVRLALRAVDQSDLSGMEPADSGKPAEEGGHIAWRLGSVATVVRGPEASVLVEEDGHHSLRFKAVDVAGNESVEREVSFKIDRTPPVGRFRDLSVGDPTLLVAEVRDETSGVADGWIEMRREGVGEFRRLESALRDGMVSARMPDEGLPDGRYEVRAVVTDVAGNRAAIAATAAGGHMNVALPVRAVAALDVRAERKGKRRCTRARRGKARRGKRAQRRLVCRRGRTTLARKVTVDHGRRIVVRGTLRRDGRPLPRMTLVVEGRTQGKSEYVPLGTATTDANGAFRRAIPAGPSRTVRFRFPGTGTLRPVDATVQARVRARVALRVDRKRVLNGQAVRFVGRLPGKPLPATGKLVALQAKVPGGWRTFATPRANARGRFSHRYRFTATTGLRRYRFRAVVTAEPAYPYLRGQSSPVVVVVRGR